MKPSLLILSILVVIGLAPIARCNIGETYQQVVARYGQPIDSSTGEPHWYAFEQDDMRIVVTIWQGVSQCENYVPHERSLSAAEVGRIFGRNSDGKGFTKNIEMSSSERDSFDCEDGVLLGCITKTGSSRGCLVATKKYLTMLGGITHVKEYQNLDAARIEHTARLAGAIFGGLLAGCICGLLPLAVGRRRGRVRLGVAGLFICLVSGGFFGLLSALPVTILFTIVILILGKPENKQSLPPPEKQAEQVIGIRSNDS